MRINIAKIVCFEADGNYTHIVLANQLRGVVGMNLGQMWQFLVRRGGGDERQYGFDPAYLPA